MATGSPKESTYSPENKTFRLRRLSDEDLPASIPLIIPPECDYDITTHTMKNHADNTVPNNRQFSLNEKAIEILKLVKKPVAILAVCGPGRSGKSFLLSRMLGVMDAFKLGHTQRACTRGIWLSTLALECDEFVLLFLDSEGTGALGEGKTSRETSMAILTLTNLLSSFLIYNSKKTPTTTDTKDLSIFGEISARIFAQDNKQFQHCLPHFCWLLRDVPPRWIPEQFDSATSYIKNIIKQSEDSNAGNVISFYYPDLECFTLPHPGCKAKNVVIEENLKQAFVEAFQEFARHVLQTIEPKYGHSAKPINGTFFVSIAQQYTQAINTGAVPNLENCWKNAAKIKIFDAIDSFVQSYSTEMERTVSGRYPMEYDSPTNSKTPSSLLVIHKSVLEREVTTPFLTICQETLALTGDTLMVDETYKSASESLLAKIATFEKEDTKATGGVFMRFVEENHKASEKQCRSVFQLLCPAYEPFTVDDIRQKYFLEAIGPAKDSVFDELFREIPEPPKNVEVSSITSKKAEIKWELPNNFGSIQYAVIKQAKGSSESAPEETSNRYVVLDDLTPATEYEVRIHAVNGRLWGIGEKAIFTTKSGPPNKPIIISISPSQDLKSLSEILIQFQEPTKADENGSEITEVIVKYKRFNSTEELIEKRFPIIEIEKNIIHLPYNCETKERLQIALSFENELGEGESCKPKRFDTKNMVPGPPQNLMVAGRGHERIKIRWKLPQFNPGSIESYVVYIRTQDGVLKKLLTCNGLSAVAKNLDSDSKFNFKVDAINAAGDVNSTGEFEEWPETKHHPAMRVTLVTSAAIGGTVAGPAIAAAAVPVASGVMLKKGIQKKDVKEIAAGVTGLVTSPLTSLVAGTVGAPVAGGVLAKKAHEKLDSDDDTYDSDHETVLKYKKRRDKHKGLLEQSISESSEH